MISKAEAKKLMQPLEELIREATQSVEKQLALEDVGWVNLSAGGGWVIPDKDRQTYLKKSRLAYLKDPLARQAIRIWTDYTFGNGITYKATDKATGDVLSAFWGAQENKSLLSPRGQRKLSDKLLVDGEVFLAIFLGPKLTIVRSIDPLEITEIITNPEDVEDVKFYKRSWMKGNKQEVSIYPSLTNKKGEKCLDNMGQNISPTEKALVAHLTYNTISQRGNPLLLPALDWIDYYRRFLASRIAIMLALAKFAWDAKVKGGQAAVDAVKAKLHGESPAAGSTQVHNEGFDMTPIKTDTGASGAYHDGKMIMHQVCAAVGIPEQYFGDISTGNLATAKTVELPMVKQFQSYQETWKGLFQEIDEVVLAHNNVTPDKWYVDRDFPPIAEDEASQIAIALGQILTALPELADAPEVMQVALMALGINDTSKVMDNLSKTGKANEAAKLTRAVRDLREVLKNAPIK